MLKSKMLRAFSLILVILVAGCGRVRNVNFVGNSDVRDHDPNQLAIKQVARTKASMRGSSEERPDQQSLPRNASNLLTKEFSLLRTSDPVVAEKNHGPEKVRFQRCSQTVSAGSVVAADQRQQLEFLMGSASQNDSQLSYSAPVAAVDHRNPTVHQPDHNTGLAKFQSKELLAEDTDSDRSSKRLEASGNSDPTAHTLSDVDLEIPDLLWKTEMTQSRDELIADHNLRLEDTYKTMKPAGPQQEQAVPTDHVAKNPWELFRNALH